VDHRVIFKFRLPFSPDDLRSQFRFLNREESRHHLEPDVDWMPIGWQFRLFKEDDIVTEKVVLPDQQDVGLNSVEGVRIHNPVRREQLAFDRFLDRPNGDRLARHEIANPNAANSTSDSPTIGGLDVERRFGIQVGAEDGLVRAIPRHSPIWEWFDHVCTFRRSGGDRITERFETKVEVRWEHWIVSPPRRMWFEFFVYVIVRTYRRVRFYVSRVARRRPLA